MKKNIGVVISWISIILNILLFAIKLWVGILYASVALIADAWHTLTDSVSSFAVLIGIKIANKPADDQHPFGHGRAELISTIFVGFLLALVGFNFTYESILKLRNHEVAHYGMSAIVVTAISLIIKEIMAQYSIFIGKKTSSKSLVADGWHHRSDALSSLIILIGLFLGEYFWWMDGVLGIIVSLLIFYTTYSILKEAISVFLGEKIDEELKVSIQEIGKSNFQMSLNAHHFLIHQYGNYSELTFHITLKGDMSLSEANSIAVKYKALIEDKHDIGVTIHIDTNESLL